MTADPAAIASRPGAEEAAPVRATFNYLRDQEGRPLFHTTHRARSVMGIDPHEMIVHDARALPAASIFDEGFQHVAQPLPAIDYADEAQRDGPYLVELQRLIRAATGASRVICDTSVMRSPEPDAFQVPIATVHSDFTPISARRLLEESWDQELPREAGLAETARLVADWIDGSGARDGRRVLAVHAWRPLSRPPHDFPLAVCARPSVSPQDVRVADFIEEYSDEASYRGELSLCVHNARHRWYQYSDMTPDEVMLFLGQDFTGPVHQGVFHSAFANPLCPPDVPGRSSIEVRTFAFFDA